MGRGRGGARARRPPAASVAARPSRTGPSSVSTTSTAVGGAAEPPRRRAATAPSGSRTRPSVSTTAIARRPGSRARLAADEQLGGRAARRRAACARRSAARASAAAACSSGAPGGIRTSARRVAERDDGDAVAAGVGVAQQRGERALDAGQPALGAHRAARVDDEAEERALATGADVLAQVRDRRRAAARAGSRPIARSSESERAGRLSIAPAPGPAVARPAPDGPVAGPGERQGASGPSRAGIGASLRGRAGTSGDGGPSAGACDDEAPLPLADRSGGAGGGAPPPARPARGGGSSGGPSPAPSSSARSTSSALGQVPVERVAPAAVGERPARTARRTCVLADLVDALERGQGPRGAGAHDVAAHAVDPELRARARDAQQLALRQPHRGQAPLRVGEPGRERLLRRAPARGEGPRVGSKASRRRTISARSPGSSRRADLDAEAEAVEQLRAQVALLDVHRPDEDEAGVVLDGHGLALDPRRSRSRRRRAGRRRGGRAAG